MRVATADGSLRSGQLVGESENQRVDDDEEGLLFAAPAPQSWRDSVRTWINAEERADRRSAAARDGCLINAEQRSSIYAAIAVMSVDRCPHGCHTGCHSRSRCPMAFA